MTVGLSADSLRRWLHMGAAVALLVGATGAAEGAEHSRHDMRAFLASLLIPGAGQLLRGEKSAARVYFTVEGGLVAGYLGFQVQGRARRAGAIEYAEVHSGTGSLTGASEDLLEYLGKFDTRDDFREHLAATARAMYGDDIARREAFVRYNLPVQDWSWESRAARVHYRRLRRRSERSFQHARQVLMLGLANRVLSGLHAGGFLPFLGHHGATASAGPGPEGEGVSVCLRVPLD